MKNVRTILKRLNESPDTLDIEYWNDLQNKNIALVSDVPTLMLSGELDHVCPPDYARDLSKNLENAYLYVFPG